MGMMPLPKLRSTHFCPPSTCTLTIQPVCLTSGKEHTFLWMILLSQAYDLEVVLGGSDGKEVRNDWYKKAQLCWKKLSSSSSMRHTWYCYKTKFFLGKALEHTESIVSKPHIFPHVCLSFYANILYNWSEYWVLPMADWNSGWPCAGAREPPQATSALCSFVETIASAPSPQSWSTNSPWAVYCH